jgi:mono/diheme cytochrome c family protein
MLKKLRILVIGVAALLLVAVGAVYGLTSVRLGKDYSAVATTPIVLPADPETLEYGRRLATVRGCVGCHGADLGGGTVIEDAMIAKLYATNLTRGEGGVAERYDAARWARAIRHGVAADGRALIFMPSQDYQGMSDEDLAAIVAYIESTPDVDRTMPETKIGPLGRALFLAGQIPLVPAEIVDHEATPVRAVERGVTVEYGRYLAAGCAGCHGPGYSGGKVPGTPPDFKPATNLTPDPETGLGQWAEADFFRALRDGKRPDGTTLDVFMPVRETSQFTDDEIRAIWLFLRSLPATAEGNR